MLETGNAQEQIFLIIGLMAAFQIKHFLADFLFQNKYILTYRHIYGHPSGLIHVAIHAIGSAAILWYVPIGFLTFAVVLAGEAVIHYHIDWLKEQVNRRLGLTMESNSFWLTLGLDQLLHQLTYVGMILWIINFG